MGLVQTKHQSLSQPKEISASFKTAVQELLRAGSACLATLVSVLALAYGESC